LRSNFVSQKYGDIYFNPDDPESEKQFVFIEANRIAERIAHAEIFTVAELGFGFGLNYALTLHAANKVDCSHKLRYFSVEENFPPDNEIKALEDKLKICREEYVGLWTSEAETRRRVAPPAPLHIVERGGRTHIPSASAFPHSPPSPSIGEGGRGGEVLIGSATDFLASAKFLADVWYFDGFSPAKNPDMWSAEVFARAFAHTRPGGTFSTYTSAGWVRRNLEAAGFVVNKVRGFGNKREMLVGHRKPDLLSVETVNEGGL